MPNYVSGVTLDKHKLDQIERDYPGKVDKLVRELALICEGYIKSHFTESPSREGEPPGVDTEALRASIHSDAAPGLAYTQDVISGDIASGVDYAAYLEYGTPRMGARPFVLPAVGYTQMHIPTDLMESVVD